MIGRVLGPPRRAFLWVTDSWWRIGAVAALDSGLLAVAWGHGWFLLPLAVFVVMYAAD